MNRILPSTRGVGPARSSVSATVDDFYLDRAISLAWLGAGRTLANPMVGAYWYFSARFKLFEIPRFVCLSTLRFNISGISFNLSKQQIEHCVERAGCRIKRFEAQARFLEILIEHEHQCF